MSATEIFVILFSLFIGYWVVSKLLLGEPRQKAPSDPETGPVREQAAPPDPNAMKPWHVVLNVPATATVDEVRQAYKILMSQYHPDKVASLGDELKALAERKSKEINAAYEQAIRTHGVTS